MTQIPIHLYIIITGPDYPIGCSLAPLKLGAPKKSLLQAYFCQLWKCR